MSNTSFAPRFLKPIAFCAVLCCLAASTASAQTVYWLESLTNTIKKVSYTGAAVPASSAVTLASGIVPVYSFVNKSTGEIYWTDNGSGKIKKTAATGGAVTDVVTGITGTGVYAQGLFVDYTCNMVYWSETGPGLTDRVRAINIAGALPKLAANASDVATGIDIVRGIMVDTTIAPATNIYYADAGTRARGKGIYRVPYAGVAISNTLATQIAVTPETATSVPQPQQLFLDLINQFVYWADYAKNTANIKRAPISVATVFPAAVQPVYSSASVRGIYINALENSLYWTEPQNLLIKKASLLTIPITATTDVVTGLTGLPRNLVYISADLVLPVSFISANAYPAGKSAMIDWTVNAEVNLQKYIVDRSTDGVTFTEIGSVNATAPAGGTKSYNLADARPAAGTNYYRIRAISLDGRVQFTPVMKVNFSGTGVQEISVYPNPVQQGSRVDVQLQNLPAGTYIITVFNKAGQAVAMERFAHAGGVAYKAISLGNAAAGQYTLRVQSAEVSFTREVLVN